MSGLWAENLRRWVPPLVVVVVGALLLIVYFGFYAGRVEAGVERVGATSAELEELEERRRELEAYSERVDRRRRQIETFYDQRLGTESARLTAMIAEIKELARAAGLEPSTISYTRDVDEDHGLVKRTIIFAVAGSYLELRRLVNLIELSEFFLTLEQVSMSEGASGGATLRINLRIGSYFADPEARSAASAERRAAG